MAHESFVRSGDTDGANIFRALMSDQFSGSTYGNKARRKKIEKRWSFSEIMSYLSRNPLEGMQLTDANALLHMYGQASHLLHADEAALNLMIDRAIRPKEELEILKAAHICRVWSDQVSIWTFCLVAFRHVLEKAPLFEQKLVENFVRVHNLSKPIIEEFNSSQEDFYSRIFSTSKRNGN